MGDTEDFEDDALPGTRHAEKRLARDQPQNTPEEMLADYDARLARRIAREIAQSGGIDSTAEHRADHDWVRRKRRRDDWWSDAWRAAGREVIRWALIGTLVFLAAAVWTAVKTALLSE